ncbi:MAG: polysaccharide biosynthesis protein [Candidatus Cyclobacteriaceae bacterium M3_2C_046]
MVKLIQSLKILPRWIIILIDLFVFHISVILAYFLRFNFDLNAVSDSNILKGSLLYLSCGTIALFITRSYTGIIRYTSLQDGLRIIYTTTLALVFTILFNFMYFQNYGENLIPVSVIIISYFNSLIFLFYYRFAVKYVFSYYTNAIQKKNSIMIFGAGKFGQMTKHIIDHDTTTNLKVIGFLEDDSRKIGKSIEGIKIYDARKRLAQILQQCGAREVIISIQEISLSRKNEIVDVCLQQNIKVRNVPAVEKWVKGELSLKQIRDIRIEDLLGRDSITLDNVNIKKELAGKRIMITGAAGSIGSEIVRQAIQYRPELIILVDQAESALFDFNMELEKYKSKVNFTQVSYIADISNTNRMRNIFAEQAPDIVFHAAAYKHVPVMESNPSEAIVCNVKGTKVVADLSVEYGVEKFVMISTDKAVNPTNVMGASKRIAEIYVQSLNNYINLNTKTFSAKTKFITTRFGNVLGSNGSVIPLFKKQIKSGGPITVTHPEITRFFMTIPEACQLVLEAGAMGKGGEIFIFDMGQSVKIVDLAKKMIQLSGLHLGRDIEIVFTGLREGEKLYEELLNQEENTQPTHHPKIMIAKVRQGVYEKVTQQIDELVNAAGTDDEFYMVGIMKELVPEFKSNYSRFEDLDKKKISI